MNVRAILAVLIGSCVAWNPIVPAEETLRKESVFVAPGATLAQLARPHPRCEGAPKASDVCFSSRVRHPANAADPLDSFATAAAFHATGFYWVYSADKAWIEEVRKRGYSFQGTLHPPLYDTVGGKTRERGRVVNAQGESVALSWQAKQRMFMGCVNNPEFVENFFAHARHYVDAGAKSLHMDDQDMNLSAVRFGGCFCAHCQQKAAAARTAPDSAEFQRQCTLDFYRVMFQRIDEYAGRHVPISCNNYGGRVDDVSEMFDFGMAELPESRLSLESIGAILRQAEERGRRQVFTAVSRNREVTRRAIAAAYACGGQIIVPWDVYQGSDDSRYFGKPDDYADLYGFVRANAALLDEYESAGMWPAEGEDGGPIAVRGNGNVRVVARALPGKADAPVVLHCLDVGRAPRPFALCFDPSRFFGGRPVSIDLLTPPPYDARAHAMAEQTKDWTVLSTSHRLAEGFVNSVDVPALGPYGLVVVRPLDAAGVWAPWIATETAADGLAVKLSSATNDAVIRYTLDGSEPSESSAEYQSAIALKATTVLTARAFAGKLASNVTVERFTKLESDARKPSDVAGLTLWLCAEDLAGDVKDGSRIARWPARVGPAMVSEARTMPDQRKGTAPILVHTAMGGRPAVRFDGADDMLFIESFADAELRGAFTLFLATRSADENFGATGTAANGGGAVPRLSFMRGAFIYNHRDGSTVPVGAAAGQTAIAVYQHNGRDTISAWMNGRLGGTSTGNNFAPPEAFGAGGHFAMPFWYANRPAAGEVAEIIAYDRELNDAERADVERYLDERYRPEKADRFTRSEGDAAVPKRSW
jgi:hypothetical protein